MPVEIEITVKPAKENDKKLIALLCEIALKKKGVDFNHGEVTFALVKRSVDARHGSVKIHLRYKAFLGNRKESAENSNLSDLPDLSQWKTATGEKKVIIVGSGPAALFASLTLLENGIKPIIIERGEETTERKRTIAKISTQGTVDANSNYCFGEGGAGTFSDGKLYTRSDKRGNVGRILQIFVHFGANPAILTEAHPHIGTEKLPPIINAIKDCIKEHGGEFHFNTKCTDLILGEGKETHENPAQGESHEMRKNPEQHKQQENHESIEGLENHKKQVRGIKAEHVKTGEHFEFYGDAVLLATGHSAPDIYTMLSKREPRCLEAKTFAVGVRIEHPRALIDSIQYHGKTQGMEAAEYRLTSQVDNRGVYTFCMCPGGFVVPSQSSEDEIVVNGMSASKRNSLWSNSAIVVETKPCDIPQRFVDEAKNAQCPALSGLYFRRFLETETKRQALRSLKEMNGKETTEDAVLVSSSTPTSSTASQAAPAQRVTDFLHSKASKTLPQSSYTPGLVSSRLDEWLPEHIKERIKKALKIFDKKMHGFITKDAVLIASETRTSTPVRILRDERGESPFLQNLYPVGEGAGYSGGIVSSAMDGEKVAKEIFKKQICVNFE